MIHFAILIFMKCEQLEGKLNSLKTLNNVCVTFRENSQMRALIFNEICLKRKIDFLQGLILLIKSFVNKFENIALYFLNIINFFIHGKEQIQVKFKKCVLIYERFLKVLNEIELSEIMCLLVFHSNEKIANLACFSAFDLIRKNVSELHLFFLDENFIQKTYNFLKKNLAFEVKFIKKLDIFITLFNKD